MAEKNAYDLSNRVFLLLAVVGAGLVLFWVFRMTEIWTNVSGGYVREISVESEGTAYVVPDLAVVRLAVNTEGETSEDTVTENTVTMNAVMEAIKGLGITEEDIKTTGYYLSPAYEYDEDGNYSENGYTLSQTVEVSLSDFTLIGTLISSASSAGANSVEGVEFTVDNPETAKSEARAEAIAAAKEKAEQIAEQSGLKLGKLVSYYEYAYDGGKGGYAYDTSAEGVLNVPVITPGEEEVSLTVTLTYQIR